MDKPVQARKWLLYAAIGMVSLIVLYLLRGLYVSSQPKPVTIAAKASNTATATAEDTDWFRKSTPTKPAITDTAKPSPVATTTISANANPTGADINSTNPADDQLHAAMKAELTANELKPSNSLTKDAVVNLPPNTDLLPAMVQQPVSDHEIQAGSIIPGVLITGINSDLPGQIIGQVRENVYDSVSGNHLLIPQGSKLIGVYNAKIAYGQSRVLIAWQRIIWPNGNSLDLGGMSGTDLAGYAGFNDQVNNHYAKLFSSVLLMSVLSAGAQLSQPQGNVGLLVGSAPSVEQTLAGTAGANIANAATALTQKNLQVQPTLQIRPGYEFNIMVTKDLVL